MYFACVARTAAVFVILVSTGRV